MKIEAGSAKPRAIFVGKGIRAGANKQANLPLEPIFIAIFVAEIQAALCFLRPDVNGDKNFVVEQLNFRQVAKGIDKLLLWIAFVIHYQVSHALTP